jgi:alpha-tubulin suppressor-like RCC1 family protein
MSLVEMAIRRRAVEVGRWTPSLLPAGVNQWVPFLLQREWWSGVGQCTVAAGRNRSFFVDANGALRRDFALGNAHAPLPTVMEELRNHRVCQVVASESHCAAVTEEGALLTWESWADCVPDVNVPELGYTSFVLAPGVPYRVFALENQRIVSAAVGSAFTVAVTEAGAVYSFGVSGGCLGHGKGDYREAVFLPKRIAALDGTHVATVAAGASHALALTRCGQVDLWGEAGHDNPVLGLGNISDGGDRDDDYSFFPHLITALLDERVRAIAAGEDISCAVTDAGAVYTWGCN